jgi:hypothetical protein
MHAAAPCSPAVAPGRAQEQDIQGNIPAEQAFSWPAKRYDGMREVWRASCAFCVAQPAGRCRLIARP